MSLIIARNLDNVFILFQFENVYLSLKCMHYAYCIGGMKSFFQQSILDIILFEYPEGIIT